MLDFRIETFLAACRHMNFTAAAEELHITQPTLSRQLMELEEELGVPLFERIHHTVKLTAKGRSVQRLAHEMLQAAEACTGQRPAQFFHTCRRELLTLGGNPFSRLWDKALRETPLRLDEGDRAVLKQVGGVLGRYDSDSQTVVLGQAVQRLSQQQREAEERQGRLGRVYGTLGVTSGLLLAIVLL